MTYLWRCTEKLFSLSCFMISKPSQTFIKLQNVNISNCSFYSDFYSWVITRDILFLFHSKKLYFNYVHSNRWGIQIAWEIDKLNKSSSQINVSKWETPQKASKERKIEKLDPNRFYFKLSGWIMKVIKLPSIYCEFSSITS